MTKNNVRKSIISCSSPGTYLVPDDIDAAVELTRKMNDFSANLKSQYPDKFGFFASLPLPAIEESLQEIDRVLEDLNPNGFVFMSNAHGLYSGDPKLAPIYSKLNSHKSIIFIHPTCPCPAGAPKTSGTSSLNTIAPLMDTNPAPIMEFIFDTTRNLSDLLFTGTVSSNLDIKWIIPHCGAVIPSLLDRLVALHSMLGFKPESTRTRESLSYEDVIRLFRTQFFFDLAGTPMNNQIHGMWRLVGPDRLLYGSDVPFTPWEAAIGLAERIAQGLPELFSEEEAEGIMHRNAEWLFGPV
jgi:predicted TIM-barrel fold metal-dependent hydrolase